MKEKIEELKRAGLFDKDSAYNGMVGEAVKELLETFNKQRHSGVSAHITVTIFKKLIFGEPLVSDETAELYLNKVYFTKEQKEYLVESLSGYYIPLIDSWIDKLPEK